VAVTLVDAASVDQAALRAFLVAIWHSEAVVAHDEIIRPIEHSGVVAVESGSIVGHVAYRIDEGGCEIVAIAAEPQGVGVGSRLLDAAIEAARAEGCASVWLTTTNDNLDALRFYQRRGFRLRTLRAGAVDAARRTLKPEIPEIGSHGIPIRDELDLVREL
jgi:ribosomal protein S18 acetylase RimI-like enzyme